ncbi:MAG: AmmeMemoRadiSam system protein B [Verrucomicrobiota bacterium]|nr:AmmeMemoRadiSam system protein B [Verrucomicrobiota bacterium]
MFAGNVRTMTVAGQFYPDSREVLEDLFLGYFEKDKILESDFFSRAIIVPHAGYQFSASTAGKAYNCVKKNDYKRVVILAPSHRVSFGGLAVGDFETLETPFGGLDVDIDILNLLLDRYSNFFAVRSETLLYEHALEVHLPFIKYLFPEINIVPIICGHLDGNEISELGKILYKELWDEENLWIISSDFTHYGRSFDYLPFTKNIKENLADLDMGAIDMIEKLDCEGFRRYIGETGATVCGRVPISLMLSSLNNCENQNIKTKLIEYITSGELTGDFYQSVSYVSMIIGEKLHKKKEECILSEVEKKTMLDIARASIATRWDRNKGKKTKYDDLTNLLKKDGASFVTLHLNGALRGCIGNLEAMEPLYLNIKHNAENAAFCDPRFSMLTEKEFNEIDIEISVLTAPEKIRDPKEFIVGKHGIILQKGMSKSVFLPQVAPEQGWDRSTTLSHLAMKAGLSPDAWRINCDFYVFEAIVFGEK